jgi:outer membrane protein assembly factor BamB
MSGVIDRQNGVIRVGPSSLYTQTGTIAIGAQVTLLARDNTGEWLYVCCVPNTNNPGWMRSVSARPTLNPTLPAPQETSEANNIRWLTVRGPDANLTPVPASAPAAPSDFPMARHDAGNTGRVPTLPRLPLQLGWPAGGQAGLAGGPYTSGAIVVGNSVIAASADGHVYSFDRDSGSQRWRFFLGEVVRATPLADGGLIFVVTETGRLIALEDQGLQAVQRWTQSLNLQPRGMVAAAGRILLTGRAPEGERLLILDRGNGALLRSVSLGGAQAQLPAVGGQTVFVASDFVRAIDLFSGDVVWQSSDTSTFTTPPLFSSPGVVALAELYVADAAGRLFAFDANTGSVLWTTQVGAAATGLAANNGALFASGPGFVRAFARAQRPEGQLLWNVSVAGVPLGGALVDDTRVFVGTDGGAFQYLDVVSGALLQGNVQSPSLAAPVAVAGPWIFAPTQAGALFAARESP